MTGKEKADTEEETTPDEEPPPYAENAEEQNDQAPPEYRDVRAATHLSAPRSPYRPFPASIVADSTWRRWKTFHLYDTVSNEPAFLVDVHTGYSGKPPLGRRPGLNLHNGTSAADPILAAAGDESQMSARPYALNPNTVILLPALEPGRNFHHMDTEKMHGAPSEEHESTFSFTVEVGKKEYREKFEWRKFNKSDQGSGSDGGFRLFRLARGNSRPSGVDGADQSASASSSRAAANCESIAVLTLISLRSSLMRLFTLELLGSARTGELGERCMLTIIMTALRLWALRLNLKTSKRFNAAAEKAYGGG